MGGDGFIGGATGLFGSDSPVFGYEKGRQEQESKVRPDPLTQKGNEERYEQFYDMIKTTGGLKGLYGPQTDQLFQLRPDSNQALQRIIQQSQRPGLTPEQWYRQSVAALDPAFYTQSANNLLSQVLQPQLESQYNTMGMGRSGAMGESLARAGAELTLPIAQQQLQNLFAVNQQRPNVDVALRQAELTRQFAGFQAGDISRQLELSNWQRKAQGLGSAFNLVPYAVGQDSKTTASQFGNIVMDLVSAALGSGAVQGIIQAFGGGGMTTGGAGAGAGTGAAAAASGPYGGFGYGYPAGFMPSPAQTPQIPNSPTTFGGPYQPFFG